MRKSERSPKPVKRLIEDGYRHEDDNPNPKRKPKDEKESKAKEDTNRRGIETHSMQTHTIQAHTIPLTHAQPILMSRSTNQQQPSLLPLCPATILTNIPTISYNQTQNQNFPPFPRQLPYVIKIPQTNVNITSVTPSAEPTTVQLSQSQYHTPENQILDSHKPLLSQKITDQIVYQYLKPIVREKISRRKEECRLKKREFGCFGCGGWVSPLDLPKIANSLFTFKDLFTVNESEIDALMRSEGLKKKTTKKKTKKEVSNTIFFLLLFSKSSFFSFFALY